MSVDDALLPPWRSIGWYAKPAKSFRDQAFLPASSLGAFSPELCLDGPGGWFSKTNPNHAISKHHVVGTLVFDCILSSISPSNSNAFYDNIGHLAQVMKFSLMVPASDMYTLKKTAIHCYCAFSSYNRPSFKKNMLLSSSSARHHRPS